MTSWLDVHFKSTTDMWATPQTYFDAVAAKHGPFVLDVCAIASNAKCHKFYSPEQDGLTQSWGNAGDRVWMNPPYGREIGRWVAKAVAEMQQGGVTVVCLLPARTDTKWWHDYVIPYGQIEFIRGRLKFGDAKHAAPFPSALVVFNPATFLKQSATPNT